MNNKHDFIIEDGVFLFSATMKMERKMIRAAGPDVTSSSHGRTVTPPDGPFPGESDLITAVLRID